MECFGLKGLEPLIMTFLETLEHLKFVILTKREFLGL